MDTTASARKKLFGLSLIIAPLLLAISTFFWRGGEVGLAGATILIYAFVFWTSGLLGLLSLVRDTMPRFATWGMLMVIFACIGGTNWANEGLYLETFRIATGASATPAERFMAMGVAGPLTLHIPGLIFPLTLIGIGIALLRSKVVPAWCAILLIIGGIGFPAGRIPRIEMVAHITDLVLLLAGIGLGLQMLRAGNEQNVGNVAVKPRAGVA